MLSNDPGLRDFTVWGCKAQKLRVQTPRTYWNTEMILSPGVFYRKPNTAELQRKFQGQIDVDLASLCLWHPCFLSSDRAAAAEKWGEIRKEK